MAEMNVMAEVEVINYSKGERQQKRCKNMTTECEDMTEELGKVKMRVGALGGAGLPVEQERVKMKVVVLGGAGLTGKDLIETALEAGHTVTAVVRNIEFVTVVHDNLTVVEGNIFEKSTLDAAFPGHDAVMSVIGFPKKPAPLTGYSDTIGNIINATRDANISRYIGMTAWYTDIKSAKRAGLFAKWFLVPIIKNYLTDMYDMEQYIEANCGDLNYTIVRPPGLTSKPKTGRGIIVEEDYFVKAPSSINQITRKDLSAFMVGCLQTQEYNKKMIAILIEPKPEPLY